jgi:glutathione S-transferase
MMLLWFYELGCAHSLTSLFFLQLIRPFTTQKPIDVKKLESYKEGVSKVLTAIDSYFLQDRKFILGNEISIADLQAVCEIEQVLATGINPLVEHDRLLEWSNRVREATNPHYQEAIKVVYGVANRLKQKLKESGQDSGVTD